MSHPRLLGAEHWRRCPDCGDVPARCDTIALGGSVVAARCECATCGARWTAVRATESRDDLELRESQEPGPWGLRA